MVTKSSAERRPSSWTEVEKAILLRIVSGVYETGQQLPSCEQLAAEVGANKNTVSKAYRSLADRGYLTTKAGRGTFVARRPARADSARVDSNRTFADVANLLSLVVQEAKMAGLQRQQFVTLMDETVARFYDPVRPRVGYVECNRLDASSHSRDLQVALSHPVEPLLIEEVVARPREYMRDLHILAVNLTHLAIVEQALRAAVPVGGAEIIGLLVPPNPESLIQVARLRPGTRVGIVCDLPPTVEALGGQVRGYNPGVTVTSCLSDDEPALRRLMDTSDVLLVTPSATALVRSHEPSAPVIAVSFKPHEHSVQQLGALIAGESWRTRDKSPDLPAATEVTERQGVVAGIGA